MSNKIEHSCVNCNFYYFASPQYGQPYPEFACTKGHWDGISSTEEYDALWNEIDCEDFKISIKI